MSVNADSNCVIEIVPGFPNRDVLVVRLGFGRRLSAGELHAFSLRTDYTAAYRDLTTEGSAAIAEDPESGQRLMWAVRNRSAALSIEVRFRPDDRPRSASVIHQLTRDSH